MRIQKYGDNLYQLTRWGAFNCYFVQEADGLTLVDTGLPGSGGAILKAARQIGLPITRVALTHAHTDHVGSLDEVAAHLPQAEIAFTDRTARFLSGDLSLLPDEPQDKLRGGFTRRQTKATRTLNPGDRFGSLEVIAAPGHAPDHVALLDTRDDTLLAGDAFQTQAGVAVAGTLRWLFPFPALATWHRPTALETARTLHRLNPSRLAVGHGRVIDQPEAVMAEAIAEAERQLGKLSLQQGM